MSVTTKFFLLFALSLIESYECNDVQDSCEKCTQQASIVLDTLVDQTMIFNIAEAIESEFCPNAFLWTETNCKQEVKSFVLHFMAQVQTNFLVRTICLTLDMCYVNNNPSELNNIDMINLPESSSIGATPNPTPKPGPQPPQPQPTPGPIPGDYPYCDYCQLVVGELRTLLMQDDAKEMVDIYVDEVCKLLPYDVDQCLDLVNMYIDEVFHLLDQYLDPPTVCGVLKFCASMFLEKMGPIA